MISETPASEGQITVGGRAHPPEQIAKIPVVGAWLIAGAVLFLEVPLFFSFFFLQQANNNHSWQPAGMHPPNVWLGSLAMALAVVGVAVGHVGLRHLGRQATLAKYAIFGRSAALLMVGSLAVQIGQMSHAGFGVSDGAYASCFFAMNIVASVLLGILACWALSLGNRASYEAVHPIPIPDPESDLEVATPIWALGRSYDILAIFMAGILILTWVTAYFL